MASVKEIVIARSVSSGYRTQKALAEATGMRTSTLSTHLEQPGRLSGYEIAAIVRATSMPDADVAELIRAIR